MPCGPSTSWSERSTLTTAFGALGSPTTTFTPCTAPSSSWGPCCGAAPTLASVSPATGAQGATVPVTLTGTDFDASSDVAVSGSGITVQNVVVVSSASITADFVLDDTATISARTVTVTTDDGTSNTAAFSVTSGVAAISGLELWLDATLSATITIATGVSAWADATGNGRSVVQATGTKQPTVVAASQNSLDIIRFDGVNDTMTWALGSVELSGGVTLFVVANPQFVNDTNGRALVRMGSNPTALQHEPSNDANVASRSKLETFAVTNAGLLRATPAGVTANGWRVITARTAPAEPSLALYKDGVLDGGPTVGFATLSTSVGDTMYLCFDGGVSYGTYDIGELIIFSRALTTVERQFVEAYLLARWGLP